MHNAESQARSHPDRLGCIEGIEDMRLTLERNSAAVIGDANADVCCMLVRFRRLSPGLDGNPAPRADSVDGVIQQVGPYLVQAGALALQRRQVGSEVLLDRDLLLA